MVGALPQPRAQSPHSGPGRYHNRVTRPETVTSPSSHIHAIRKERTYSWPSRPHPHGHQDHIVSPREQRHEVDQEIRTAGRTNPRPRPPSVPPAANGPRRLPSPVAAIRSILPFASTPVGWNSRPGANGQRRSEPAGRRYRRSSPAQSARPDVQANHVSGLPPAIPGINHLIAVRSQRRPVERPMCQPHTPTSATLWSRQRASTPPRTTPGCSSMSWRRPGWPLGAGSPTCAPAAVWWRSPPLRRAPRRSPRSTSVPMLCDAHASTRCARAWTWMCAWVVGARGGVRAVRPRRLQSAVRAA
jgi:hypothetical protein